MFWTLNLAFTSKGDARGPQPKRTYLITASAAPDYGNRPELEDEVFEDIWPDYPSHEDFLNRILMK